MTASEQSQENFFLTGPLAQVFLKTALPIILIMSVNGSFTLVDAYFLGEYVGAAALTSVTLMFPLYMLMVALATWVASGYASVVARQIGGGKITEARHSFAQALGLSWLISAGLILFFSIFGAGLTLLAAKGDIVLAADGYLYISILIFTSPLMFMLTLHSDSFRSEGLLGPMTLISVSAVLLNMVYNYILIVEMDFGVAGSAYGTVLAHLTSLCLVIIIRRKLVSPLSLPVVTLTKQYYQWRQFLALGASSSLGYLGVSLSAGVVMMNLQLHAEGSYDVIVAAYGIVTRLMTFTFLPLLGLSMAFQTITGHNFGAHQWQRTNRIVCIGLGAAFLYCLLIQAGMYVFRAELGAVFVDDQQVQIELARILPLVTLGLWLFGPLLLISSYFQAIGDAKRALLLGVPRTYLFSIPLTFAMPVFLGEAGIWYAGPVAELCMLGLTVIILWLRAIQQKSPYGLFCRPLHGTSI